MTRVLSILLLVLVTNSIQSQSLQIIKSPNALPFNDKKVKIFLGGSIDMGKADNWQSNLEAQLKNKNIILFNPRRDDWNKDWKPISADSNFRKQVEWELAALELSDIIIMYFAPNSQSPISLLEFGMYAKSKKLMVVCPEGFWRKGNVDIVCERYNIEMYNSLELLVEALKNRVKQEPIF